MFVVVDRLTKHAHFIPLTTKFTTYGVVDLFFKDVYKLHCLPYRIICDRDPKFVSHFCPELLKSTGVTFNISIAYHPQTYGKIEVVNKCLEGYL